MARKRFWATLCLVGLGWPLLLPDARGQGASTPGRAPIANVAVEGRTSAYLVQFDRPIDHLRSTLAVMRERTLVQTLTPRADSRPEVLFARAPTLPPGDYKLHWQVRTLDNIDTVQGEFAFRITR